MGSHGLAVSIEDEESSAGCALVDGPDKGVRGLHCIARKDGDLLERQQMHTDLSAMTALGYRKEEQHQAGEERNRESMFK